MADYDLNELLPGKVDVNQGSSDAVKNKNVVTDNSGNVTLSSIGISDLPTANSITDGDTTHVCSCDVIHDYIDAVIGDADDWLTS